MQAGAMQSAEVARMKAIPMRSSDPAEVLLSALRLHGELNSSDEAAVRETRFHQRTYLRGETVVQGGTAPQESCFVISGFASREMILPRGARQFVGMYIRGDFVDLHAFLLDALDHDVVALTDLTMAFVSHQDIKRLTGSSTLNQLLWRFIAIDAAIQRCWLASMARRQAPQRLAHFLCEQHVRLQSQGLAAHASFELPISQATLGDVLGLSAVHMNRSLQSLRKSGLVQWQGANVTIDQRRLPEMCGFEPSYLNLNRAGCAPV